MRKISINSSLACLNAQNKARLLAMLKQNAKSEHLSELLQNAVDKYPNQVALEQGETQLTYLDLQSHVEKLASYLHNTGMYRGDFVLVHMERSIDFVITVLAIMHIGAVFVPMDISSPIQRLLYIAENTQARFIICDEISAKVDHLGIECPICFNETKLSMTETESAKQEAQHFKEGSDLAYVIYTSGSTGLPKGVLVEHHSVMHLLESTRTLFDFDQHDVWLLFHSHAFDFAIWELFGALFYGAKLVVSDPNCARNIKLLHQTILDKKVTILNQTPFVFKELQRKFIENHSEYALKYVIFGGDKLDIRDLLPHKSFYQKCGIKLVNMFGITEATVHASFKLFSLDNVVQAQSIIGLPIPGYEFYLCSDDKALVADGEPGTLFIGGPGLARGYLGEESLTREKFVELSIQGQKKRVLNTGDQLVKTPEGEYVYLGRVDNQVSIRGVRVELDEINVHLAQLRFVQSAQTLVLEENGTQRLISFLCINEDFGDDWKELTYDHLRHTLNERVIPSELIKIDVFPITSNGKLDKAALLDESVAKRVLVAPRNELEERVFEAWKGVLNLEEFSVFDNFYGLGGDSIKALQVLENLSSIMPSLTLADFLQRASVAELVEFIKAKTVGSQVTSHQIEIVDHSGAVSQAEEMSIIEQIAALDDEEVYAMLNKEEMVGKEANV